MELHTNLITGMSNNMSAGVEHTPGTGQSYRISLSGSGDVTSTGWELVFVDSETGEEVSYGGVDTANLEPTFVYTYDSKVYMLAGDYVFFSEINDPTWWNDPAGVGNGYVQLSNHVKTPEDLVSVVQFQGKLAFLSRQTTQIWNVAADPANWSVYQVLQNIGCLAKASVQPKGDLDAFFLSDTGVRNLRAKEVTLGAFVDDIGSPIDSVIQQKILTYPDDATEACSVIEPSTGQYWLFLKDTIYVLSYYPASKVLAWSTFTPVDNTGTTFTPEKFVVYRGRVYCRAGNKVYIYGGSTGLTYDSTKCIAEIPWTDLKSPGTEKMGVSINAAFSGQWRILASMDVNGESLNIVYESGDTTYGKGLIPMNGWGHHFKARMECSSAERAIFSSLVFHYDGGDEK
jgi:hypothetical protein